MRKIIIKYLHQKDRFFNIPRGFNLQIHLELSIPIEFAHNDHLKLI
jgi:hypothetical protein